MAVTVVERSGRRLGFAFMLTCALALMSSPASAQEATIFGQVRDDSGGVLPGVTVTVSSPALQVKQLVEVTNATGEYRVTPLPLGSYTVEYTLPGFQTLRREGIRLTAGFVARVDVALEVGGVAETVTVSGASPVVDVKTTSGGTQVTSELLETIPTNRNSLNSVLTLAAGSRGLSEMGPINPEAVYMAFGRFGDPWLVFEGIPTVSASANNPNNGNRMNFEMVEEAAIRTFGGSAESLTAGIQVNVIIKSGANDFHGSAAASTTTAGMQGNNINDELRAQGITEPRFYDPRVDANGELGGRLIRDKLWFYTNFRRREEGRTVPGGFFQDGSTSRDIRLQRFQATKGTLQLTQTQKLIGVYWFQQTQGDVGPGRFQDFTRLGKFNARSQFAKAEWQWAQGNKFLSIQGGNAAMPSLPNQVPEGFTPEELQPWRDEDSSYNGGINDQVGRFTSSGRSTARATMNWYQPDLFHGTHDFKFGAEYNFRGHLTRSQFDLTPAGNYERVFRGVTLADTLPVIDLIRGNAVEIVTFNNVVEPKSRLDYLGMFFQDSWAVNRRLTLNLGVRYANDQAWLPAQCREAGIAPFQDLYPAQCFEEYHLKTWNTVSPRLHAAWDVTGDGKTVLKGGFGRFYMMYNQNLLDPFTLNTALLTRFRWRDLNGNQLFDVGEANLARNGPDFLSEGLRAGANLSGLVANPDLEPTGSNEVSISLERELMANLGLRVTGVYSKDFGSLRIENTLRPYEAYSIPITNRDPGPDNRLGTADDPGTSITYFDYPASLAGAAFQRPTFINHSGSDATYKSLEVAAVKRLADRWQLTASHTASRIGNAGLSYNYAWVGGDFDPNYDINRARNYWQWLTRITASYMFPLDIQTSANVLYQSGSPWQRSVSFTGGQQVRSLRAFVEPLDGSRRGANPFVVMFRAEKQFRLPRAQRISVQGNILNVTNDNSPDWSGSDSPSINGASGSTFGYVTAIQGPRMFDVVVKYSF